MICLMEARTGQALPRAFDPRGSSFLSLPARAFKAVRAVLAGAETELLHRTQRRNVVGMRSCNDLLVTAPLEAVVDDRPRNLRPDAHPVDRRREETGRLLAEEDRADNLFVEHDDPGAIDADIVLHELRRVGVIVTEEAAVCHSQSEALERGDIIGPERPQRQSAGSYCARS